MRREIRTFPRPDPPSLSNPKVSKQTFYASKENDRFPKGAVGRLLACFILFILCFRVLETPTVPAPSKGDNNSITNTAPPRTQAEFIDNASKQKEYEKVALSNKVLLDDPALPLLEGCFDPSNNGNVQQLFSNRTGIPVKLEKAYEKLDAYLDRHAPLQHRVKWKNSRPQGVAAIKLQGMKVNFLWNAIIKHVPNCRTVCEVGLNAGHSSILWMEACPNATAILFDMPYKKWSRPALDFLRTEYSTRVTITEGNSLKTIPEYASSHPDWRCDLIAIDGSKDPEIRFQDFLNFEDVAHDKTLFLLDDASIEIVQRDFKRLSQKENRNMTQELWEAQHPKVKATDLNGLYTALFGMDYLRINGACSYRGALSTRENSTISAFFGDGKALVSK